MVYLFFHCQCIMALTPKRFYRSFDTEMTELTENQMGFWTTYANFTDTKHNNVWKYELKNGDAYANFEINKYTNVGIEIGRQRYWCSNYNEFKDLFTFDRPLQGCMLRYHKICVLVQCNLNEPPILTFDTIKYTADRQQKLMSMSDKELVRQSLINDIEFQYKHGMGSIGHINNDGLLIV